MSLIVILVLVLVVLLVLVMVALGVRSLGNSEQARRTRDARPTSRRGSGRGVEDDDPGGTARTVDAPPAQTARADDRTAVFAVPDDPRDTTQRFERAGTGEAQWERLSDDAFWASLAGDDEPAGGRSPAPAEVADDLGTPVARSQDLNAAPVDEAAARGGETVREPAPGRGADSDPFAVLASLGDTASGDGRARGSASPCDTPATERTADTAWSSGAGRGPAALDETAVQAAHSGDLSATGAGASQSRRHADRDDDPLTSPFYARGRAADTGSSPIGDALSTAGLDGGRVREAGSRRPADPLTDPLGSWDRGPVGPSAGSRDRGAASSGGRGYEGGGYGGYGPGSRDSGPLTVPSGSGYATGSFDSDLSRTSTFSSEGFSSDGAASDTASSGSGAYGTASSPTGSSPSAYPSAAAETAVYRLGDYTAPVPDTGGHVLPGTEGWREHGDGASRGRHAGTDPGAGGFAGYGGSSSPNTRDDRPPTGTYGSSYGATGGHDTPEPAIDPADPLGVGGHAGLRSRDSRSGYDDARGGYDSASDATRAYSFSFGGSASFDGSPAPGASSGGYPSGRSSFSEPSNAGYGFGDAADSSSYGSAPGAGHSAGDASYGASPGGGHSSGNSAPNTSSSPGSSHTGGYSYGFSYGSSSYGSSSYGSAAGGTPSSGGTTDRSFADGPSGAYSPGDVSSPGSSGAGRPLGEAGPQTRTSPYTHDRFGDSPLFR